VSRWHNNAVDYAARIDPTNETKALIDIKANGQLYHGY
jgi:hypothetical protein